ncbi:MAG: SPOR domain-containing protein [Lewinellaceae bacterium]|nr:SPOR domain-containing protein [Lewinellaceae bacterium]
MSRLDIFTIAVVIICVAAIIFLLYRTTDLFKSKDALNQPQQTEESLYEDDGTSGDDYTDDPYYNDTSEFDFLADTTSDSQAATAAPAESKPSAPATTKESTQPVRESKPVDVEEMEGVGNYLVLAGAFTIMANAEAHAKRLQKLGFSDAQVALFNKGKYATVLVGRYESKSDATALVGRLADKGVEAYVHLKRGAGSK